MQAPATREEDAASLSRRQETDFVEYGTNEV
jgi:hypothetical protein